MRKNTKILTLVFVVAFLILLTGCLPTPTPPNEAPIITSTPITTSTIGVLYTYDVNATDPDEDTLTYSLITKPKGMAINSKTGVINWTPTSTQIGDNPVTVKVSDGTLDVIQSFAIKVKAVNHAPTINSIPVTTATVGVTYVYGVNATDPDNDVLTYSLTAYPSGMTISSATGLVMWTSIAEGNYAVVVKASDGALSDTQSFTIKVSKPPAPPPVNHAPIITSTPNLTTIVGVKYTYTIKATDPEGDPIIYSLVSGPTGMTFNGIATISWTPVLGQIGANGVTVKASDGKKDTIQNFTITVSKPSVPTPPSDAELTSLWEDLKADLKPGFNPGVYEYSLAATYDEETITIAATTDLEDATIKYDYEYTKKGTEMGEFDLFVGKNIITITVEKGGYQTTTYTITVTRETKLPVHNVSIGEHYATIQEAINDAKAGNTIYVSPGTYPEHIIIDRALTVKSTDGAAGTIIDSIGFRYIVDIRHSDITFEGFTVTDPTYAGGSDATGILIQSTGAISNVQIFDNIITQVRSDTGSPSMYGATGVNIGKGPLSDIVISGNTIIDIDNPDGAAIDHTCGINVWDGADNVLISNNEISDIKYNGILLQYASNVQIKENSITRCESGVRVEPFLGATVSDLTVKYNNLFGNTEYGVLNKMDSEINATDNWWGHTSGPTHSANPDGTGDAASDKVGYIPWSESPN